MARETDDFAPVQLYKFSSLEDLRIRFITFQEFVNALLRSVYIASNIEMEVIGTPTFTTVQHMQDIFHSAGYVSGNGIVDEGSAEVSVIAGEGLLRILDDGLAILRFATWNAMPATGIPTDTVRYVGIQYNGSSKIAEVVIKTTDTWDYNTDFPLGSVVNEGGILHISNRKHAVGDHANFMIQRSYETQKYARDNNLGGLELGELSGRFVTVSVGAIWIKLERVEFAGIDTSTSPVTSTNRFDIYYSDGIGGWNSSTVQQTWDNIHYDDGSGTLAVLTTNRYGVLWCYLEPDGQLVMMYGVSNSANLGVAEAEGVPGNVPVRISEHAFLIGRIIFRKSDATATEIQTVFATQFTLATGVPPHTHSQTDITNLVSDLDLKVNISDQETRGALSTRSTFFMVSGTVASDATTAGTNLYYGKYNSSGQLIPSTTAATGTWKNLGVQTCTTTLACEFVRTL